MNFARRRGRPYSAKELCPPRFLFQQVSTRLEHRVENGSGDKETPPLPSPKGIVFPTRVDIVGYFNPQFEA